MQIKTEFELTVPMPCPPEGLGVNTWCWHAANWAYDQGLSFDEAYKIINSQSSRSDSIIREKEIHRALTRAYEGIESRNSNDAIYYKKPDADLVRAVTAFAQKLKPAPAGIELDIRDILEPGYYAVGEQINSTSVLHRDEIAIEKYQYICANPLIDPLKGRCRENLKNTNITVVEFDDAPNLDWQYIAHYILGTFFPLIILVYSGNKSVHGWYKPNDYLNLKYIAALLGADIKVINSPEQWVRIPNGRNTKTDKQQIVYGPQIEINPF